MKKLLSLILCVILIMPLIFIPAEAESRLTASLEGVTDGDKAYFNLTVENGGSSDETIYIYMASYSDSKTVGSARKVPLEVKAGERFVKTYEWPLGAGGTRIFVWDKKNKPICKSFSSDECKVIYNEEAKKLPIGTADAWAAAVPEADKGFVPANVFDGNLSTYWTASDVSENTPQSVTAYLGDIYTVSRVGLAFGKGNERNYVFSVSASVDGEDFVDIIPKTVSEKVNSVQYFDTARYNARYIRINMLGRTDVESGWVQLCEAEVYAAKGDIYGETVADDAFDSLDGWDINAMSEMTYTDYEPTLGTRLYAEAENNKLHLYDDADRSGKTEGENITPESVSASQVPEAQNKPENVLDGSLDTKWTAKDVTDENPAELVLKLDRMYYLTKAALAFGIGNERVYTYSVALSEDGKNFETVVQKKTSDKTLEPQEIKFNQKKAQYVKFTFYKRADSKDNGWLQVTQAEVTGTESGIDGAGGVIAQKRFYPPQNRSDYEIDFKISVENNTYFSGFSLTDGQVSGGSDLSHYAALQLRFDNSGNKVKVNYIKSNYFNEGTPRPLFESEFKKGVDWDVTVKVSPGKRRAEITIDDGTTRETKTLFYAYNDDELTRPSRWTGLEANTFVFNTGAGAKCAMKVSDFTITETETERKNDRGTNAVVRLEAVRLSGDLSGNAYFGRFVTHNGADGKVEVTAERDPALTRFVEREGLIGCGVSLEAVTEPGYFLVVENGTVMLRKLQNNGAFLANATFMRENAENLGYYTGTTVAYRSYVKQNDCLYDSSEVHRTGTLKMGSIDKPSNMEFYLRSEAVNYVADNFYGNRIGSQWWTNFPWKSNNPVNDSYNYSALITKNNVIVEKGELFLKATKIGGNDWAKDMSGETGIQYNKWGKTWEKWKGYVGVVSIQNKVFNRQCYVEGSFKQPDSPVGYWNAFWLTGRDSWPPEIDIFEFLSSRYGHSKWNTGLHGQNDKNNVGTTGSGVDLTNGYHTFALDWGYDYMKFYVDGKKFYSVQKNDTVNFQKNVRLILNTGIGGWEAEPDGSMVWDDGMRCRYIRSFQY